MNSPLRDFSVRKSRGERVGGEAIRRIGRIFGIRFWVELLGPFGIRIFRSAKLIFGIYRIKSWVELLGLLGSESLDQRS